MEKDKEQKQPQGGNQPQGGPPTGLPKAQEKLQEQIKEQADTARDYRAQLGEAQAKYLKRVQESWASYYERAAKAYDEYQADVRNIYEGEQKAFAQAPKDDESPEKNLEAFKKARLQSVQAAQNVQVKLRDAERKYNQHLTAFWDDVFANVADAVQDFLKWIVGWWQEPPVEGGGANRRNLPDPAWGPAFDPGVAAYYSGWNYGPQLY